MRMYIKTLLSMVMHYATQQLLAISNAVSGLM